MLVRQNFFSQFVEKIEKLKLSLSKQHKKMLKIRSEILKIIKNVKMIKLGKICWKIFPGIFRIPGITKIFGNPKIYRNFRRYCAEVCNELQGVLFTAIPPGKIYRNFRDSRKIYKKFPVSREVENLGKRETLIGTHHAPGKALCSTRSVLMLDKQIINAMQRLN